MATTHIAGLDITLEGHYRRQLCAWCGVVILDQDFTLMAWRLNEDGSDPGPPGPWPVGRLITKDGPITSGLDETVKLPDDFCGWATLAKPEDFAEVNE